jgi:enamine deaminase RidA (YjgF/YER057c/UK114 family)
MERTLRAETETLHARTLSRFVFCGSRRSAAFERPVVVREQGVVWLRAEDTQPVELSSMQAFAVSGTPLQPVQDHGCASGFVYEDKGARYCRLSGVVPRNRAVSREAQAQDVFETLDAVLTRHGFRFTDTVRTWFYLDRLLDWYGGFNTVRTAFFKERGVLDRIVPASTGIGAGNPLGAALTCDLLAIQPKSGAVGIQAVPSPMQSPAMAYKSSFSRAVEVTFPTHRNLLVSGTASIDAEGHTARVGDPAGQVALTMEVVAALLRSRGMDWADVSRGIAYFANPADSGLLGTYRRVHDIPGFPLAVAHATVCRQDLLFEIEVDAVRMSSG